MFIIFTILSFLIGVNFLLLMFSCNKTTKKEMPKVKGKIIKTEPTIQYTSSQLAPTGS